MIGSMGFDASKLRHPAWGGTNGGMVQMELWGLEEAQALFKQVDRELNNRMRRALRRGAKVFREGLRDEARSRSDLPRSFRKTRTRPHRNPLGVSVSPSSSLSNIFERGATTHQIGKAGQLLSNFATRREKADKHRGGFFFARGPVTHPGIGARPFIGPVFEATEAAAQRAIADELFKGIE